MELVLGGKMYVSDVVLTGELSAAQKNDVGLLCACVSGALPKDEYISKIIKVGFEVNIIGEDKEITNKIYREKMKNLLIIFIIALLFTGAIYCRNKKNKCSCNCAQKNQKQNKKNIKEVYENVAKGDSCSFGGKTCNCRAKISEDIGYTKEEIEKLADANLGLGCGNPINLGEIKVGQTILDLGSGAGLDCLLASKKVGESGKVIGIDMSPAMIDKSTKNALKYGYKNVEFRLGDIENLPVADNSIDIIISNCVLSLASDKKIAFKEAHRVLNNGGLMYVSDIVLLRPLSLEQRADKKLVGTCPLGAILRDDYIKNLLEVGFEINILDEDFEVNKKKFNNNELPISSLKYIAIKK